MNQLIFYPYKNLRNNQWYALFTAGFLHKDFNHLLFNMFTLYYFGSYVEAQFTATYVQIGAIYYVLFYLISIAIASMPALYINRNNPSYQALGASGAVSAVLYFSIIMEPWSMLYIFGIIPMPSIVFGVIYLIYESYMAKKGTDNIGHDAHISGAVFGVIIAFLFFFEQSKDFFNTIINF